MDGLLNTNKPKGITSYDVIRFIKKNFHFKGKIGHSGTLDPAATGVLLVCLGKATKLSSLLMAQEKEYEATLKLGIRTDTLDEKGKILSRIDKISITEEATKKVLFSFIGEIKQVPPLVSALKYQGRRMYEIAREGKDVPRKARRIIIKEIKIKEIKIPFISFRVVCSKGTYVRALCRDIGEQLGCGAFQSNLIRKRIGPFLLKDALTLERLKERGLSSSLIPISEVLNFIKNKVEQARPLQ
ncbi:MAG: tRNA pseudouridine(55) synthase TruB [bacterium (Candidatus Ratteibacteria) CG_4_10_14_3_um_filter_41_18]|uniref:tRNA pseudouridine synthase B n=1 Tax=bacterium (Candidatus Ratteibacteria) CG_4_10_14_3_um_filter_41_18 TaxID=2014287 RepID=A0A2M7M2M4_9BACT|nr:MAG: tRNA pseudouridine(55) synthase TruB [bacterium (Candidatus Ratteibacteria) CG_4_10_14_3_um_filter_41_18]